MHHWRFELATGRCLTSDDDEHHLRTERIAGADAVLIDLHAHTAPRSNCSRTTLEELVETARARGLDALCITEHDVRWPGDELADASRLLDFPLIPGVELTTDVGHVLVFGPLRKPLWMGYSLAELVEECEHVGHRARAPAPAAPATRGSGR